MSGAISVIGDNVIGRRVRIIKTDGSLYCDRDYVGRRGLAVRVTPSAFERSRDGITIRFDDGEERMFSRHELVVVRGAHPVQKGRT